MYGESMSERYCDDSLNFAIKNMVKLGYSKEALVEFSTHDLKNMYSRLKEIKKNKEIDKMIEELNEINYAVGRGY